MISFLLYEVNIIRMNDKKIEITLIRARIVPSKSSPLKKQEKWSIFQKPETPFAKERSAVSTLFTRSPNTRLERHLFSLKVSSS